jgi:hypothetical protein
MALGMLTRKIINGPNIAFWKECPNSCAFTEFDDFKSLTKQRPASKPPQ